MKATLASALILTIVTTCVPTWRMEVLNFDLHNIDLSITEDGMYTGEHQYRNFMYSVKTTVQNHEITDIEIVNWDPNEAREKALAIFDRVIQKQSLCVDAITGATTASKLYLLCIEDGMPHLAELCPE